MAVEAVVLDLGNVVIEWDPRRLYRPHFPDSEALEHFLATVTTSAWNAELDRGKSFAQAVAELSLVHPDSAELIEFYLTRWPETLGDLVPGIAEVMAELRAADVPLYALSNWSAETFPIAEERYALLAAFDGIVLSGHEGVAKPDPEIFQRLCARHSLTPATTFFTDDSVRNVEAAAALGFRAHHFTSAAALRSELIRLGVLGTNVATV